MNKKVYRNQVQLMHASNRKRMYKKGKQWIVASSLFLSLLAGGSLLGVHADSVQPQAKSTVQATNQNKNQVSTQQKTTQAQAQPQITAQANNLHNHLLNNSNNTYQNGLNKLANVQDQANVRMHRGLSLKTNDSSKSKAKDNNANNGTNPAKASDVYDNIAFVNANDNSAAVTSAFGVAGSKGSTLKYSASGSNALDSFVPNGFKLSGSGSLSFGSTDDFNVQQIPVVTATKSDIDVKENPVDIDGTVYLHTQNHSDVALPFSFQAKTNDTVDVLDHTIPAASASSNGTPSDYDSFLNKKFGLSNSGYEFNSSNQSNTSSASYSFSVSANSNAPFQNGTPILNRRIDLYFNQASEGTEIVDYRYHGNIVASNSESGYQGNTQSASALSSSTGYYVPADDTFTFSNGSSANVPVLPESAQETIQFKNGSSVVSSITVHGNSASAKAASDTSMKVSQINPNDVPAGYHLASANGSLNSNIPFSDGSADVQVVPTSAADQIIYENGQGQILGSSATNGSTGASFAISNGNLPTGYVLPNNSSESFNYDGNTHLVQLSGSSVNDSYTINLSANGKSFKAIKGSLSAVGDSITIYPNSYAPNTNYLPANSDVPTTITVGSNGSLNSSSVDFNYNDINDVINAKASNEITVNYVDNGKTIKTGEISKPASTSTNILTDVTVPAGYQVGSAFVDKKSVSALSLSNYGVGSSSQTIDIDISGMNGSQLSQSASSASNNALTSAKSSADSAYSSASSALSSANGKAKNDKNDSTLQSKINSLTSEVNTDKTNKGNMDSASNLSSADSSADSAETSAKSASNSANSAYSSASAAVKSADKNNNQSAKNSANSALNSAKSASTSANNAESSADINAKNLDSATATTRFSYNPDTYITIIEKDNGKTVNAYASLVDESDVDTGSTFTIKPSDVAPTDYTPSTNAKNQNIVGKMTANGIDLLPSTETFVYDKNNASVSLPVLNHGTKVNKGATYQFAGADNDPLSTADVPAGYELDPTQDYHFDGNGKLVNKNGSDVTQGINVIGKKVNGKANIILHYVINGQNSKSTVIKTADDAQVVINGRVGDTIKIDPWRYVKANYSIPSNENTEFTIPSDAVDKQYDYGQNYNPTLDLDYNAQQAAEFKVVYKNVDATKGTNSDVSSDFITIPNGVAGETVYLGAKNTNVSDENGHYNVLNIPTGYYLPDGYVKAVLAPATTDAKGHNMPVILTVNLHLGSTHTYAKQAMDPITFSADPFADTIVKGTYGDTGYVNAPAGYHFINGENGRFTFSNKSHDFDISKDATPAAASANNNTVNFNLSSGSSITPTVANASSNSSSTPNFNGNNGQAVYTSINNKSAQPMSAQDINKIADQLKAGQTIAVTNKNGHKVTIRNKAMNSHYRWLYVIKPIYLHKDIDSVGFKHDVFRTIKPNHRFYARINKIYKLISKHKVYIRYEITVKVGKHNHTFFVTGNPRFVRNSYYQLSDLHKAKKYGHKYYLAKVLKHGVFEYKGHYYTKANRKHLMKANALVHVKKVVRIGRKGDHQTKFELTNGQFITANKNFIKLV